MAINVKNQVVLVIVDGFGIAESGPGNAIELANTPNWEFLRSTFPCVQVSASGKDVGLPDGVMGNSEVGHLTIGTGRITYQSLERINQAFSSGDIYNEDPILNLKAHLTSNNSRLHLLGLLSDGKVHSDLSHLLGLIDMFQSTASKIYVHGFTDGRDTPRDSSLNYITELEKHIYSYENVSLASIIGRYYAMDRDKKWDRTKIAYDALFESKGEQSSDIRITIQKRYAEGETDEFLTPIILEKDGVIKSGDAILFFNFRPDRARQLTQAINYQVDFPIIPKENIHFLSMTRYDESWDLPVLFDTLKIRNSLAEILASNNLAQAHIAETEKYAHVTYFLNGGQEEEFSQEVRIMVPSPKISTYDLQPEMSTPQITTEVVNAIKSKKYPFIVVNIACTDMVGHTGNIPATIKAVEALDDALGKIYLVCNDENYTLAITSDHGNAEKLLEGDQVHTAHTTNQVPFLLADKSIKLKFPAGLKNIAPTLLEYMGISVPVEMNGGSILK